MKKFVIFIMVFLFVISPGGQVFAEEFGNLVKNRFFSITLPENFNVNGEEEIEKNAPVYNIDGVGIIDIYIKKCLQARKNFF